ncbi:hypothetical protein, partial [Enterocloster bolteae]|uniref:hypothetical protein n=2 Tax=Enterocloster bolteae TaxID=208479 RepID=UPI003AF177A9
ATRCGWYMTTIPSLSMSKSKEVAAMEPVTCRSCRRRNKCSEYSRMMLCRSYKKWTPDGWSRPKVR